MSTRLAILAGAALFFSTEALSQEARPAPSHAFTIADGISSTRFVPAGDGSSVFFSPDGQRYAVALVSGDVASDQVWLDIRVGRILRGVPTPPLSIARLSTSGLGAFRSVGGATGTSALTGRPLRNTPKWIDSRHIAFLWSDRESRSQVYVLDVVSGRGEFVTDAVDDVMAFATSPSGRLIVEVRDPPKKNGGEAALQAGFTVSGSELNPVLAGYAAGTSGFSFTDFRRYVGNWRDRTMSLLVIPDTIGQNYYSMLSDSFGPSGNIISPDGRYALLDDTPQDFERRWLDYKTPELELSRAWRSCHPQEGQSSRCNIRQLYLADLVSGTSAPLIDAPLLLGDVKRVSWSPSGRWLLFGPTYLPKSETDMPRKGWVIVDLQKRQAVAYPQIPEVDTDAVIEWTGEHRFTVRAASGGQVVVNLNAGGWSVDNVPASTARADAVGGPASGLTVKQDANTPPKLFYTDRKGASTLLLDPNPQFSSFNLAKVEMINWEAEGAEWEGRLYVPNGNSSKPWPLVIQIHDYANGEEFSLYGPGLTGRNIGLGPGRSAFIAQSLASRGIAVLTIGTGPKRHAKVSAQDTTFDRLDRNSRAIIAGIVKLADRGIVDRTRVGIMGWSAGGRFIEHAITTGDFPYAAAIVDDGADSNYLQYLTMHYGDSLDAVGGSRHPTAPEIVQWIARSPALNADRVRTPVYFQVSSASEGLLTLMWHWEMYAALSAYQRPVEYYVIPDVRHGAHAIQNPRQLMSVQNRALDWWLFWLKGEMDADPSKEKQYKSWEKMRGQAEEARREPRRPLLQWTSKPK